MSQRFISKNTRRKYIRPLRNGVSVNRTMVERLTKSPENKEKPAEEDVEAVLVAKEEPVTEKKAPKRGRKKTPKKAEVEENNEKNTEPMNENIEKIKQIVGDDVEVPERKVKIEKRDKGLLERTENSTILITEDNKMMLND